MKKILSIISIVLVIATLFTITGCSKKAETKTDAETQETTQNQSQNTTPEKEDKENYTLEFVLNPETKQGFKIKIPNKYKEAIKPVERNNATEIYFMHTATNLTIFKLTITDKEAEDAIATHKIDKYVINALKGDTVNAESEDGKVIAEIQGKVKEIMQTITTVEGVQVKPDKEENKSDTNETTEPSSDIEKEMQDAEVGKEISVGNGSADTMTKNEDGSITYSYIDDNGEKQSFIIYPDSNDKEVESEEEEVIIP